MVQLITGLAAILGSALLLGGCTRPQAAEPKPRTGFLRGMVISAQTWGKEWASPQMKTALEELHGMGVNAITIHPYAWIGNQGALRFDRSEDPDYVRLPMQWARQFGMTRMLTPHIGYWGTKFLWRGEISFESDVELRRFFRDYEEWILLQARLAAKYEIEIFVIGLEYVQLQKYEAWWRALIGKVRGVYQGKITYGANWDEVEKVPFWDAVDYIGVLAYFPLTKRKDPSLEELSEGWRPWTQTLRRISAQHRKPVLFVEAGYNESAQAAAEPWAFAMGGAQAKEIRKRCTAALLDLEYSNPDLAGMFLWKWFPDVPDDEEENFDMRAEYMRALLRQRWGR